MRAERELHSTEFGAVAFVLSLFTGHTQAQLREVMDGSQFVGDGARIAKARGTRPAGPRGEIAILSRHQDTKIHKTHTYSIQPSLTAEYGHFPVKRYTPNQTYDISFCTPCANAPLVQMSKFMTLKGRRKNERSSEIVHKQLTL